MKNHIEKVFSMIPIVSWLRLTLSQAWSNHMQLKNLNWSRLNLDVALFYEKDRIPITITNFFGFSGFQSIPKSWQLHEACLWPRVSISLHLPDYWNPTIVREYGLPWSHLIFRCNGILCEYMDHSSESVGVWVVPWSHLIFCCNGSIFFRVISLYLFSDADLPFSSSLHICLINDHVYFQQTFKRIDHQSAVSRQPNNKEERIQALQVSFFWLPDFGLLIHLIFLWHSIW